MAFTQKHADQNRAALQFALGIVPDYRYFYALSRRDMSVLVDQLLDQMQEQFPDVSRDRLSVQLFNAIKQKRR